MTRALFTFFGAVACACVIAADPAIPATLKSEPGRLIKIEAEGTGKVVRWLNPDPDNLDLIPIENGRWAIVSSPKAGVYRIACWSALEGVPTEASICVLTVGVPTPPKPPQPSDPVAAEFQKLFDAEPIPHEQKRQVKDRLAALYRVASGISSDRQYLTTGMLATAISRNAAGVGEGLTDVKRYAGALTLQVLGADPTMELTAAKRAAGASLFEAIAKALEAVK